MFCHLNRVWASKVMHLSKLTPLSFELEMCEFCGINFTSQSKQINLGTCMLQRLGVNCYLRLTLKFVF